MSTAADKARILISEDDPNLLDVLKALFRSLEHRVKTAVPDHTLPQALHDEAPDIFVCSYHAWTILSQPPAPAEQPPHQSEATSPDTPAPALPADIPPTIVLAGYAELEPARQALQHGAFRVLPKPVRTQNIIQAIADILALPRPAKTAAAKSLPIIAAQPDDDNTAADQPSAATRHFGLLIGEHPAMQALYDTIAKVAVTDLTVLIRGESGTGKDLVARAIHQASARAGKPFVALNCTAVPENLLESELFGHVKGAFTGALHAKEGLFAAADGGTIFLDEIGSIPVSMQLSLLRVLQDRTIRPVGSNQTRTVNVRVVAATNENLEQNIQQGRFREDLYFRLAAFPLTLPPLRDRATDVPLLAATFLDSLSRDLGRPLAFTADALDALTRYPWPGNVRELQNLIGRGAAVADRLITAEHLALPQNTTAPETAAPNDSPDIPLPEPPDGSAFLTLKAYLKACERSYMKKIYEACGQDKEKAARVLGISIGTFYRKFEE